VNQSKQITAASLRQAHPRTGAHLALVHDNSTQSEFPAPFTPGWARRLVKTAGMPPTEIRDFTAWVCSIQGLPAPSRPHLRVIR